MWKCECGKDADFTPLVVMTISNDRGTKFDAKLCNLCGGYHVTTVTITPKDLSAQEKLAKWNNAVKGKNS